MGQEPSTDALNTFTMDRNQVVSAEIAIFDGIQRLRGNLVVVTVDRAPGQIRIGLADTDL
jgi:hypothetical protein